MRSTLAITVLIAILSITGRGQSTAPWTLIEHTVATGLKGGYHVTAADFNKDGRTDLLAVATGPKADLVWFENPVWTPHVMASGFPGMINSDAFDVDGDGYPEVVLQSGFSTTPAKGDGRMILLTKGADVNAPWTAKEFDRMPSVHRVRWIDAHGNGRKIVVNAPLAGVNGAPPDYKDTVGIYAYDPKNGYKRETITDADEGVVHGIQIVDWDGRGREALLSASFLGIHLHRFNNGKWERTRLAAGNADPWPKNGSSDVVTLRTKAGRQLAAIEPWHGNQVVVYRGKGEKWDQRTVIDDTLIDGHTLVNGDLDGDGVDEIIAGYRGSGGGVNIYKLGANGTWTRFIVASPDQKSMAAAGCALAHLNNDKRLDLACIGSSTANLKWYENQPAK
ncbi:MAG TPA: VCBS repeat-containing protein [Vicinamibacterales bacterium]|nr:VCBS repeat-containing protein [Vicinamibacterales bacterium]